MHFDGADELNEQIEQVEAGRLIISNVWLADCAEHWSQTTCHQDLLSSLSHLATWWRPESSTQIHTAKVFQKCPNWPVP